jgi:uncharacterized protein (TIGR02594 family)
MKFVFALSVALATLCSSADARPRHSHVRTVEHASIWSGIFGGGLVSTARSHLGSTAGQLGLPRSLWCADFMNMVMRATGHRGTGSRTAKSYLALPHTSAHVGAIAVLRRRGGGHVGVVSGFDGAGNPIVVSGNHNSRVGEGVYPKGRVIAFVSP